MSISSVLCSRLLLSLYLEKSALRDLSTRHKYNWNGLIWRNELISSNLLPSGVVHLWMRITIPVVNYFFFFYGPLIGGDKLIVWNRNRDPDGILGRSNEGIPFFAIRTPFIHSFIHSSTTRPFMLSSSSSGLCSVWRVCFYPMCTNRDHEWTIMLKHVLLCEKPTDLAL